MSCVSMNVSVHVNEKERMYLYYLCTETKEEALLTPRSKAESIAENKAESIAENKAESIAENKAKNRTNSQEDLRAEVKRDFLHRQPSDGSLLVKEMVEKAKTRNFFWSNFRSDPFPLYFSLCLSFRPKCSLLCPLHCSALFIKRFHASRRDKKVWMWSIVYPFLVMLMGIGLLTIRIRYAMLCYRYCYCYCTTGAATAIAFSVSTYQYSLNYSRTHSLTDTYTELTDTAC